MNVFEAGVQYNDFLGSTAADRSDNLSMIQYLQNEGIASGSERFVGARFGFSGNHGAPVNVASIVVYLVESNAMPAVPEKVRAVEVAMKLDEFFKYFKRLDFVMTAKGMDLSVADVDGPH